MAISPRKIWKVPFLDLKAQHEIIRVEVDQAIAEVFSEASFVGGPFVAEFEKSFSSLLGVKHCIGIGNCTDALLISLKMLGLEAGGEVITPALSWISSAETITMAGGKVVFADIHPDFYTIDPAEIEKRINPKTKGVIAVHLYGQMAQVNEIKKLCDKHGLFLIEDCAQGQLTKEGSQIAGTIGDAGAFSFYPSKNLGAYGDGGCVTTNNDSLAKRIRMFANHGSVTKEDHQMEGVNSRLDALQASILKVKSKHLPAWNENRRKNARYYQKELSDLAQIKLPSERHGTTHTNHLYVIRTLKRDELGSFLAERGVEALVHYPQALPLEPAYHYLGHSQDDFPVSVKLAREALSLPIYPELTQNQLSLVTSSIREFFGSKKQD